jgi:small subunit ribosomal protein S9
MEVVNTIGRRKTSVARIYLESGKGQILVNDKDIKEYFSSDILETIVKQPLKLLKVDGNYDIRINVDGGGTAGQAEAVRLAISRALCEVNPDFRSPLKKEGFLTRDPEW